MSKSEVMDEFFKLMAEQDQLSLSKTAAPEKNPHQEDAKTIEEKRQKSPEKSIIEEAHPEPVYVAEARGDGGLVENQIEQQKKLIEMINKHPTGSLVGRYATAVHSLIKMAKQLDEMNELELAGLLTDTANQLVEQMDSISEDTANMLEVSEDMLNDLEGLNPLIVAPGEIA